MSVILEENTYVLALSALCVGNCLFLYGFYAYGGLAVALAICCASCSLWVIALDWSNNTPACMTMIHQRNHQCLPGSPTLVITLAGY